MSDDGSGDGTATATGTTTATATGTATGATTGTATGATTATATGTATGATTGTATGATTGTTTGATTSTATDATTSATTATTTGATAGATNATDATADTTANTSTSAPATGGSSSSSSASAENMTLRTLQQYRLMAADRQKVEPLTRDGTVAQFLAYVLEDRDEAIVTAALETIVLLCGEGSSRRQLARTYGLVPALQCLKMKDSGPAVLELADKALAQLRQPPPPPPPPVADKPRVPSRARHKVVTLHVTGLVTDDDRDALESVLVRVRGMVSIVFDMGRGRCTCRVRDHVTVGTLASAVDRTEAMAAYQVVRGADGDEELVPVSKRAKALERPAEEKLPEYLPEDDGDVTPGAGAVAPDGFFKQASGWLSSASSYLSRSFYW